MFTIKPLETSKDKIKQPSSSVAGIIPQLCSSMLFVGSSGSGKTTLLVRLMTSDWGFKGWFNEVYLISPTARWVTMFKNSYRCPMKILLAISRRRHSSSKT